MQSLEDAARRYGLLISPVAGKGKSGKLFNKEMDSVCIVAHTERLGTVILPIAKTRYCPKDKTYTASLVTMEKMNLAYLDSVGSNAELDQWQMSNVERMIAKREAELKILRKASGV